MFITDIIDNSPIINLTLIVKRRWNIRSIFSLNQEEENFSDDGPLKDTKKKVFSVLTKNYKNQRSQKVEEQKEDEEEEPELMLFFYDIWAEKLLFIQNEDKLIITGSKEMIYKSSGDINEYKYCLIFTTEITSQVRFKF